jgi:signal transduction histidine kinase
METRRGFDDIATIGVGIAGMRQRLHQLGGRVEIRSDERGTRIIATVPIMEESNHG